MSAIALPDCPLPEEAVPFLRDFGGNLIPFLGGPEQRINRIGTRFGVRYTMPAMDPDEGRVFVSRLLRARSDRALMAWPLADYDLPTAGSANLSASFTGGSAITVSGLNSGVTISEGRFFSIVHGGRRYIHMSTGDVNASGGSAALIIFPPLRVGVSSGDDVEFDAPLIEGLVSPGDEVSWQQALTLETNLSFTIVEAR